MIGAEGSRSVQAKKKDRRAIQDSPRVSSPSLFYAASSRIAARTLSASSVVISVMLWAVRAWSAHCSRMSCSVSPCATKSQSMPTSLQLTTLAMLTLLAIDPVTSLYFGSLYPTTFTLAGMVRKSAYSRLTFKEKAVLRLSLLLPNRASDLVAMRCMVIRCRRACGGCHARVNGGDIGGVLDAGDRAGERPDRHRNGLRPRPSSSMAPLVSKVDQNRLQELWLAVRIDCPPFGSETDVAPSHLAKHFQEND